MTGSPSERYAERAIRHEVRSRNYRRQAILMLERDSDIDCAGALLYESAKQCINAIANQLGANPGTIGGKVNVLREVAASETDGMVLMENWQHVDKLHIHADRGHLSGDEFDRSWQQAQAFITAMLTIYSRNA